MTVTENGSLKLVANRSLLAPSLNVRIPALLAHGWQTDMKPIDGSLPASRVQSRLHETRRCG